MSTISGIINSTLSALNTYTYAINVTNTNIANAETDGYSRQKAVITTGQGGNGVDVAEVKRIYDSFLTSRVRSETQDLGKWDAENTTLASVEEVFTSTSDYGLSSAMDSFWSNWQAVVSDPSSSTARSTLASSAETLANDFNSMSTDLSNIQKDIDGSVVDTVTQINDLVKQIAQMNQNIADASAAGENTNTYKDSLDSLVLDLSKLADINTYTDKTGQVSVEIAGGKPLVEGTKTWSLSTQTDSSTGLHDIVWTDGSAESSVITGDISSGKLGGYLEVRDGLIPDYQDQLNTLASTIMEKVNALHTSGYDSYGDSGASFFTGTSAADMAVSSDILTDPGKIAASSSATTDDGSNASAIAKLQNSLVLKSGTTTFSNYYNALVSDVGETVKSTDASYSSQSDTVTFCQNQRDSVSAVSTDEELTNLTLYQNAYSAAAKVMTVLDEMLKTLIDMGT
jgi:flagellar hook-associated protein 1 FlgK